MNQAAIVAVGTELLFGSTINTNAAYISEQLHEVGIGVLAHYVVGDNPRRLKRVLEIALKEADIILVTGGLGPTQDDLTKETIAEYLDVELIVDEEAKRRLDVVMARIGTKHYTSNNFKQALLPKECTPFYNEAGTAPGFALECNKGLVIAMPGPPREMKRMMLKSVIPYLSGRSAKSIYSQMLHFYGIGESALETRLLPLIDGQTDPTIAPYAREGECTVRITSMRDSLEEAKGAVSEMVERARELAGEYLYSDRGQDYPEVVVENLRTLGIKLVAADACTNGLLANAFASVLGGSEVLDRSFVACSDQSIIEMLDVSPEITLKHGSVSKECCEAMAFGALKNSDADIAVSVTGQLLPGQIQGTAPIDRSEPIGSTQSTASERAKHKVVFGIALRGLHENEPKIEVYEREIYDRDRAANCQVCVLELCSLVDRTLKGLKLKNT